MNGIWAVLGIEPTHDRDTVRRAYAARLKSTNPEDDAEGFQRLRAAYETALRFCRTPRPASSPPPAEPEPGPAPETEAPAEAVTPTAPRLRPSFRPAPARPVVAPADVLAGPAPMVSPAPTQRLQLEAALRRLAAMLGGRQASTPEALRAALDEILASPALEDISIYDGTERRLAQLIAAHIPASDPLIEPACEVFAWSLERRGRIAREAEAVLQRAEDLKFLRLYQSPRHPRHRAYRALAHKGSDRMRRVQAFLHPRLAKDVKGLIEAVEFRAPTAIANFDPEALAWWRAFLARPATGPVTLCISLGVALAVAALASRTGTAAPNPGVMLAVFVLSLSACGAVVLGWLYGVARPRRWWLAERQRNATLLERFGWAPLSWLFLLVAGLLPNNAIVVVLALAAALVTTWWVLVVGEPDRRPGGRGWRYRMLLAQIPPLVWWVLMADPASGPRVAQSLAFAGALAASVIGGGSQLFWYHAELTEPARRRGRLAVAAGGVLAALALVAAAQRLLPVPVMAALIAAYVFAHRPIVANLRGVALQVRYWIGVIAVLTLPSAGVALHWSVAIQASLWLMLTTTAGLLFSWTQDQPPLLKRRKAGPKAAPLKR